MNRSIKPMRNLFTCRILEIKLTVKELRSAKFYTILLVSVMLVGIFSLSPVISTLMKDVMIRSFGRIGTAATTSIAYKSEIRGVFVHCATFGTDHDWDVIAQTCNNYKIDTIYGEFVSIQSAYYPSTYLPQFGSRDEIAEAIAACHSRGMKLFISMDVIYVPGAAQTELKCERYDGTPYDWTCPTKQATRTLIKNVVEEIAANYDIDGFTFDYVRYATDGLCYCSECRAKFEDWLGEIITNWDDFAPGGSRYNEFMEWRVVPVTEIVRDMRTWMLTIKPDLEFRVAAWTLFGTPPFYAPTYWRYWMGQDTADWVNKGYIDICGAMMYSTVLEGYPESIQAYFEADTKYFTGGPEGKVPLVPTITTGVVEPVDPNAFKAVVDKLRELGADGWVIWRYGGPGCGITPDITEYLALIDMPDVFSLENIDWDQTGSELIVTWTTTLPVTSKVEYSTSPLFTASFEYWGAVNFHYWDVDHVPGTIAEDLTPVTNHSITLTGLFPETKYYFRVQSEDTSGVATSKVFTFTTD